jgi:hypothetical protein
VTTIRTCALPVEALLAKYGDGYTDCYSTVVTRPVSHAEYVEAFYTGAVFKLERLLLAWLVSTPSTDAQARQLALGALGSFSAWKVEDRAANQLLMCALDGRTRSWLMIAPLPDRSSTRLYFGSAVVPVRGKADGKGELGFLFKALLGFHKLYSRVLLHGARSSLARKTLREPAR